MIQMVPHCLYILDLPKHAPSLAKKGMNFFYSSPRKAMCFATKGEVGLWETIACFKKYLFYIPATCQMSLYIEAQEQSKI